MFQGGALTTLKTFPNESVDMCVTSPPYWNLRNYGDETAEVFGGRDDCQHKWVWYTLPHRGAKEASGKNTASKVTGADGKPIPYQSIPPTRQAFCTLCGAWQGQLGLEPYMSMYVEHLALIFDEMHRVLKKEGSAWVNIGETYSRNATSHVPYAPDDFREQATFELFFGPYESSKAKRTSLCGIPERFKIAMLDRGWMSRNTIIWQKPNQLCSPATDRFTVDYEYFYWFVKQGEYYFEQQKEPCKGPTSKAGETRNKRTVWSINTRASTEPHFAMYPEELITTPIIACSPPGGLVIDPFMGTGTTAIVSKKNGRDWCGIEINPKSVAVIERRTREILGG